MSDVGSRVIENLSLLRGRQPCGNFVSFERLFSFFLFEANQLFDAAVETFVLGRVELDVLLRCRALTSRLGFVLELGQLEPVQTLRLR